MNWKLEFLVLLNKIFPKYELTEEIEEIGNAPIWSEQRSGSVSNDSMDWSVDVEDSEIEYKCKKVYTHKGKYIGEKEFSVIVPFTTAYAKPVSVKVDGVVFDLARVKGFPAFRIGNGLYDTAMLDFPPYRSGKVSSGVKGNRKTREDIDSELEDWITMLDKKSSKILSNARS